MSKIRGASEHVYKQHMRETKNGVAISLLGGAGLGLIPAGFLLSRLMHQSGLTRTPTNWGVIVAAAIVGPAISATIFASMYSDAKKAEKPLREAYNNNTERWQRFVAHDGKRFQASGLAEAPTLTMPMGYALTAFASAGVGVMALTCVESGSANRKAAVGLIAAGVTAVIGLTASHLANSNRQGQFKGF